MHARRTLTACHLFNEDLVHAIDLEVIKARTNMPSESTQTHEEFRANLLERDVCCVWTGAEPAFGAGLHIIPYRRGSEVPSIIFCWEYISSSPFPSATVSVVSSDRSESTKLQRGCDDTG
jgi:hypothetical protein